MKHFEFETYVRDDDTVKIPKDVTSQIERERPVHVNIVVPEDAERQHWAQLTAELSVKSAAPQISHE